jgi:hypothetical protein
VCPPIPPVSGAMTMMCNGVCVDPWDATNCGGCGKTCNAGQFCAPDGQTGGKCVDSCPPWLMHCGGSCVPFDGDPLNCGACGNVCSGGQICLGKSCRCQGIDLFCGGACTSQGDANCGACGHVCSWGHVCAPDGMDGMSCQCPAMNEKDCSGVCVDTTSNNYNCGGCNKPCLPGQSCCDGQCQYGQCH